MSLMLIMSLRVLTRLLFIALLLVIYPIPMFFLAMLLYIRFMVQPLIFLSTGLLSITILLLPLCPTLFLLISIRVILILRLVTSLLTFCLFCFAFVYYFILLLAFSGDVNVSRETFVESCQGRVCVYFTLDKTAVRLI